MAHVRLRDPVKREVTVKETVRPALTATECDACGALFVMRPWCGDRVDRPDEEEAILLADPRFRRYQERNRQRHVQMGQVSGTFDRAVDGRGNMFGADACSFECAHALLTHGWKSMAEYREFADAGAKLIRGHFDAMLGENLVLGEEEIVAVWEKEPEVGLILTSNVVFTLDR